MAIWDKKVGGCEVREFKKGTTVWGDHPDGHRRRLHCTGGPEKYLSPAEHAARDKRLREEQQAKQANRQTKWRKPVVPLQCKALPAQTMVRSLGGRRW